MSATPFSRWEDVPLTCRIADIARVCNVGQRTVERWLKEEPWRLPPPNPRVGRTEPLTWSKATIQRFLEHGGQRPRRRPLQAVAS